MAPDTRPPEGSSEQPNESHQNTEEGCRNSTPTLRLKDSQSVEKNKKCFITIVLPSQNDGFISDTEKTSEDRFSVKSSSIQGASTGTEKSRCYKPCSRQHNSSIESKAELVYAERATCDDNVPQEDKNDQQKLTNTILNMYEDDTRQSSEYTKSAPHQKANNDHNIKRGTYVRESKNQIIEKVHSLRVIRLAKNRNTSESTVDIGGWQEEVQKTPKVDNVLRKRTKTFPTLNKRYNTGGVNGAAFKFEHHDDINRYILDYRVSHTAGGVDRKQLWDGTLQNIHHLTSSKRPQRSLGIPGYRVNTTDPAAKTFLPKTPLLSTDLHGGCIFCEKERFRLRNSFPKRVFLSWTQYMTLCKSNTFLMSNGNNSSSSNIHQTTLSTTPRVVTSYSPSRPLLLLNQREKMLDIDIKYQNINDDRQNSLTERKKSDTNNPIIDKTLLVYRLSGKRRNSINGVKSDQSSAGEC